MSDTSAPAHNIDSTPPSSSVKWENIEANNITANNAVINAWTRNRSGKFFSTGFFFGTDKNNMTLYTTSAHNEWTDFYNSFSLNDYYGLLAPKTKYYYRFYLITESDMSYHESDIYSFTTGGNKNMSFDHITASEVSSSGAILEAWAWNEQGLNIKTYGVMIGTDSASMTRYEVYSNIGWTNFHTRINAANYCQLKPNTTYYYRFYGLTDGWQFSDIYSFTTPS